LRGAAGLFRTVADGLDTAHEGCSKLAEVRGGTSWCGDGFSAFQETVDRNPTPADISNAQSVMFRAASACEVLADGIEDCQERIEWCRGRIDSLCIGAGGEISDEQRPVVEAIKADADAALEDYGRHVERAEETFGTLEGETTYAQPPPGFWDQVGGTVSWAWGNVRENWNGFFDEGGIIYRLNDEVDNPLEYLGFSVKEGLQLYVGMWEGVTEMWDGAVALAPLMYPGWSPAKTEMIYNLTLAYQAYQQDPRQFMWDTGEAVLDYETLRESPARWLGKLIPTIAIGAVTGGAGAAGASRIAAVIARIARIAQSLRNKLRRPSGPDTTPDPDRPSTGDPEAPSRPPGSFDQPSDSHLTPSARHVLEHWRTTGSRTTSVYIRVQSRGEIDEAMRLLGPGSRARVTYWDSSGPHQIEVFNFGGTVRYGKGNVLADDYSVPLGPPTFINAEKMLFQPIGYMSE
jgi:hypothetical protein